MCNMNDERQQISSLPSSMFLFMCSIKQYTWQAPNPNPNPEDKHMVKLMLSRHAC